MRPATTPPDLAIVISATGDSYPHHDARAGQTARHVSAGVRSLELLDDRGGRWLLVDASPKPIVVGYNAGDRTPLTVIDQKALRPGHYVGARMVQDWSRFEVDATLHDAGKATAGTLKALQVTSDGSVVDGLARPSGYYEHVFVSGQIEKKRQGESSPFPQQTETAEAFALLEDGAWAVYFPLDVHIVGNESGALEVSVNMDRAFRWSDLPLPGYQAQVYDLALLTSEPVRQFGGNRFTTRLLP